MKGRLVRRVVTTLLLTLSMVWLAALPALATEGQDASESVEGGGDNAFLYLLVFGIVWGIAVFLDANSHAPADEGTHGEAGHH